MSSRGRPFGGAGGPSYSSDADFVVFIVVYLGQFLLFRDGDKWVLPGGKRMSSETNWGALERWWSAKIDAPFPSKKQIVFDKKFTCTHSDGKTTRVYVGELNPELERVSSDILKRSLESSGSGWLMFDCYGKIHQGRVPVRLHDFAFRVLKEAQCKGMLRDC